MTPRSIVFIADSPMTLGIQFLIGEVLAGESLRRHFDPVGLFSSHGDFSRIEEPYTPREMLHLLGFLRERAPAVVGLSTIERTRARTLALVPEIRRAAPGALVLSGGIDAVSAPAHYLARGVDMVVMGDGESPLGSILEQLASGTPAHVMVESPPEGVVTRIKPTSGPARGSGPLPIPHYGDRLFRLTQDGVTPLRAAPQNPGHAQFLDRQYAIDMFTQRGCTHACSFCAQDLFILYGDDSRRNSRRIDLRAASDALVDVKQRCPEKNAVYFWDLDFLRRPKAELLHFAEDYPRRVGLPFFVFVTEKSVLSAGVPVIARLAAGGMKTINMGIQSGSERVLRDVFRRNNTPDEARAAISVIHEATRATTVEILYDIVTYNPLETPDEILMSIRLVLGIPTDGRQKIRLSTHKLSSNTGQPMAAENGPRTFEDYQDFVSNDAMYEHTQSPYLSWLLGKMMRGPITRDAVGSLKRSSLRQLCDRDFVARMNALAEPLSVLYKAIIPRESDAFLGPDR